MNERTRTYTTHTINTHIKYKVVYFIVLHSVEHTRISFTCTYVVFTGFAGANTLEEAQVLMIGSCAADTLTPLFATNGLKEEKAKARTHTVDLVWF